MPLSSSPRVRPGSIDSRRSFSLPSPLRAFTAARAAPAAKAEPTQAHNIMCKKIRGIEFQSSTKPQILESRPPDNASRCGVFYLVSQCVTWLFRHSVDLSDGTGTLREGP